MFVFTLKQYAESFAFLILGIIELFTFEVCKFLKKCANFLHIRLFLFVNKNFIYLTCACLKN